MDNIIVKEFEEYVKQQMSKNNDDFFDFVKALDLIKKRIRDNIADYVIKNEIDIKHLTELKMEYKIINRLMGEILIISKKYNGGK